MFMQGATGTAANTTAVTSPPTTDIRARSFFSSIKGTIDEDAGDVEAAAGDVKTAIQTAIQGEHTLCTIR